MRAGRGPAERPPALVLVLAVIAALLFALPFIGLIWRLPWSTVLSVLGEEDVRTALWLSIRTTLVSTALSLLFGVPLA